jgi:hypothetical protein
MAGVLLEAVALCPSIERLLRVDMRQSRQAAVGRGLAEIKLAAVGSRALTGCL